MVICQEIEPASDVRIGWRVRPTCGFVRVILSTPHHFNLMKALVLLSLLPLLSAGPTLAETPGKTQPGGTAVFCDVLSDLNNDGTTDSADAALRDKALASADPETVERATEWLLTNDTQSNGRWDGSDPANPKGNADDDDLQELRVKVSPVQGLVWFEHPALAYLAFYPTRACDKKLRFPLDVSRTPLPETIYLRAEGLEKLKTNAFLPLADGDLVLKAGDKPNGKALAESRLHLRLVRGMGDPGHLSALRDYIEENNTTHYVKTQAMPGGNVTFVVFLEEMVEMRGINAALGRGGKGDRGIGEVASDPRWGDCSAVINCTYTFDDSDDRGFARKHNGKLISQGVWDQSCSVDSLSDPIPVPGNPGGKGTWKKQDPRYLISRGRGQVEFGGPEAECPADAREGTGGLRPNHFFANGVEFPFNIVGELAVRKQKLLYMAVADAGWKGNSNSFYLPFKAGSNADTLFHCDPIGSVAIAVADPAGALRVRMNPGFRHPPGVTNAPGHYLKTYLGVNSVRPRP